MSAAKIVSAFQRGDRKKRRRPHGPKYVSRMTNAERADAYAKQRYGSDYSDLDPVSGDRRVPVARFTPKQTKRLRQKAHRDAA